MFDCDIEICLHLLPEAGTTQDLNFDFVFSHLVRLQPTSRSTHQESCRTSLEYTRWSLRSSSERTQSFRFPPDQPGHLAHGVLEVCRQRVSLTTRKGWKMMLEHTLPIGANSIYGVSAGRLSLTVFTAAASSRGTSLFVYTHPPCSNLVYSV
jgi:hypothetical protein